MLKTSFPRSDYNRMAQIIVTPHPSGIDNLQNEVCCLHPPATIELFKRSRSSAIATPSDSETDWSQSPNKQVNGELMAGSPPFTDLGSQDEENPPPSAFAGTDHDLGPPAVDPEDNQYSVECLLGHHNLPHLGGRNRRK